MKNRHSQFSRLQTGPRNRTWGGALIGLSALALAVIALPGRAQDAPAPAEKVIAGYATHQTIELGGHIADHSGSAPMWDTLVNLQSGPRILSHSLNLRSVDSHKTPIFDDLTTSSFGYGGDPYNATLLRFSKGKLYQFDGSFRRNRQYFDYNLLANPLIPSTAVPYVPVLDTPHLFNTVRRMTDVNLTLLPLSRVSFRAGYSKNTNEGPTFNTVHSAVDALLNQWWRNSTDVYSGGVDFKLLPQTTLSYDQFVTRYKGDTTEALTGLNYQVVNGAQTTPVSLGINIFNTAANTNLVPGTTNTIKSTSPGEYAYTRFAPTRTLFPTEQVRFSSASIKHVNMNGRILYTGATGNVDHYSEFFQGYLSRTGQRQIVDAGAGANSRLASVKRINVLGDYGVTVQVTPKFGLSDVFDFWAFRDPGNNTINEASIYGTSLISPLNTYSPATCPPPYTAATCPAHKSTTGPDSTSQTNFNFLGQNTKTNTILASWDPIQKFKVSIGYRYRTRTIHASTLTTTIENYTPGFAQRGDCKTNPLNPDGTCTATTSSSGDDVIPIHENWGLFGIFLQPTDKLRVNFNVDAMYADNAFTRVSPRQLQHYRLRSVYKLKPWANVSGAVNLFESRNNVADSHHLEHSRDYSFGASIAPGEKWSLDFNYSYNDVFSRIDECYVSNPAPGGAVLNSAICAASIGPDGPPYTAAAALASVVTYSVPTQFGSLNFMVAPVKRLRANLGYRMSAVDGHDTFLNPRQVPGSLQSQYQSPYANLAFDLAPNWVWKADWNYYGYGEGSPIGPTLPRSFRGNVYTLGVRYAF